MKDEMKIQPSVFGLRSLTTMMTYIDPKLRPKTQGQRSSSVISKCFDFIFPSSFVLHRLRCPRQMLFNRLFGLRADNPVDQLSVPED